MITLYGNTFGFCDETTGRRKTSKKSKIRVIRETIEKVFPACIKRQYHLTVLGLRVNTEKRLLTNCNTLVCKHNVYACTIRRDFQNNLKSSRNDDAFTMMTDWPILAPLEIVSWATGLFTSHNYIIWWVPNRFGYVRPITIWRFKRPFSSYCLRYQRDEYLQWGCHTLWSRNQRNPAKTECDNS